MNTGEDGTGIVKLDLNLETPIMKHVFVNVKPTQEVHQDPILREYIIGGMGSPIDVRMILDVPTLQLLLATAMQSQTKRVIIDRAGIRIKLRRSAKTGHIYETLHIDGRKPVPERAPTSLTMPVDPRVGNHMLRMSK